MKKKNELNVDAGRFGTKARQKKNPKSLVPGKKIIKASLKMKEIMEHVKMQDGPLVTQLSD